MSGYDIKIEGERDKVVLLAILPLMEELTYLPGCRRSLIHTGHISKISKIELMKIASSLQLRPAHPDDLYEENYYIMLCECFAKGGWFVFAQEYVPEVVREGERIEDYIRKAIAKNGVKKTVKKKIKKRVVKK